MVAPPNPRGLKARHIERRRCPFMTATPSWVGFTAPLNVGRRCLRLWPCSRVKGRRPDIYQPGSKAQVGSPPESPRAESPTHRTSAGAPPMTVPPSWVGFTAPLNVGRRCLRLWPCSRAKGRRPDIYQPGSKAQVGSPPESPRAEGPTYTSLGRRPRFSLGLQAFL